MNTSNFYKSLTIEERKRDTHLSDSIQNLNEAKNFWQSLLVGENITTDFEKILKENYEINSNFFERTFQLNENQPFENKNQWYTYILMLFQQDKNYENDSDYQEMEISLQDFPFYPFFSPFLKDFYYSFLKKNNENFDHLLSNSCLNDIIKKFLDSLYSISHKTLILEINALRISGALEGSTSKERYQNYCEILKEDVNYRISFIEEYPVLLRIISTKIIDFKSFLLELFTNFSKDKHLLKEKLNIDSTSKIKNLNLGSGDSHKKGKTVTILELENGQKVVYKPRSLGIDIKFQSFLSWINDNNPSGIKQKKISVLNQGNYGWSEFVTNNPCKDIKDVKNFYQRIGQLLGVLHIMNATDFHFENIISNGEFPVLIDLESLFHHTISPDHKMTESESINKALRLINDSVLSTGVIPHRTLILNGKKNFDLSGIGNTQDEQVLPFKMGTISNQYTDEVKLSKTEGKMSAGLNNPRLENYSINISDYLEEIEEGFSFIYNFFMNNKKELKSKLSSFKGEEVRKLFRDTMKYGKLLDLSYHPDFLRNQLDREILINRLRIQKDGRINIAAKYEIEDLLQGDIPYFSSTPESNHLYSSNSSQINNFYYRDGMTLSLKKADNLNDEDLKNQLNIIRTTVSAVYSSQDAQLLELTQYSEEVSTDTILKKSVELGDILLKNAIKHKGRDDKDELAWISMVTQGGSEETWTYSVTGPGLYDGNCGIALYYSYLWKVTGEPRFKQAAYASLLPIQKLLPQLIGKKNVNLGGFLGIGGIIYTLHQMGKIFDDPIIKQQMLKSTHALKEYIQFDQVYDIIGGSAGALIVVLNLYEEYEEPWILDLADQLANHLIKNARPQSKGVAWVQEGENKKPYIGFSHGNAGIIYSLARYITFNPSNEVVEVINRAIEYENIFLNVEKGNWFSNHLNDFSLAWCHGAPGILLTRNYLKELNFPNENVERDALLAFETTLFSGNGKNYSLCHGDLGLLDLLQVTSRNLETKDLRRIENVRELILSEVLTARQLKADINVVGLMSGIASIGYGLLRTAYPKEVPSVLILENHSIK